MSRKLYFFLLLIVFGFLMQARTFNYTANFMKNSLMQFADKSQEIKTNVEGQEFFITNTKPSFVSFGLNPK